MYQNPRARDQNHGVGQFGQKSQQVLAIPGEFMMTVTKNFEARGTHLSSMRNIVAE
jgi:hypothetical protein